VLDNLRTLVELVVGYLDGLTYITLKLLRRWYGLHGTDVDGVRVDVVEIG
jgi:hypothetical protein